LNLSDLLLMGWLSGDEDDFDRALRQLETAQAALVAGDLSRAMLEASEARLLGQKLVPWSALLSRHIVQAADEVIAETGRIRPRLMPEEFPTSIIPLHERAAEMPWIRIETPRRGED